MANINQNSSNGVMISLAIDGLPVPKVENFMEDPWTPDNVDTADVKKTADNQTYMVSKNRVYSGTLSLASFSEQAKLLDLAWKLSGRIGNSVKNPPMITMIITDLSSGDVTTFTDGTITQAPTSITYGAEEKGAKKYQLKFGTLL